MLLLGAARDGDVDQVRILLARGVDANYETPHGTTPLIWAVRQGHMEIIEMLLWDGADVHYVTKFGNTATNEARYRNRQDSLDFMREIDQEIESQL